jgi:phosphoribosylanthranilate isomerase
MTASPRVKICCISTAEEAQTAIHYGADALGLVGHMPSGPGVIPDAQILTIASFVPPPVATFLLTSKASAQEIIDHHRKVRTTTIQLVDELIEDTYPELRRSLPGIKLVQVVQVVGESSIERAERVAPYVDALLLDSGNPHGAVRELGGTGRTPNWQLSRRIVEAINIPVFLAGGLTPDNVREAWETVQPFGLDVCSGLRTRGHLDPTKVEAFMTALAG